VKTIALEQLPQEVAQLFETAQTERVLITRNGLPFAQMVALENKDQEDLQLETSPEFWQMIEDRRREQSTVSLEEFMAELDVEEKRDAAGNGAAVKDQTTQTP